MMVEADPEAGWIHRLLVMAAFVWFSSSKRAGIPHLTKPINHIELLVVGGLSNLQEVGYKVKVDGAG